MQNRRDPVLSCVLELVQSGWEGAEVHPELIPYAHRGIEMTIHHGILMWGSRVVVLTKLGVEAVKSGRTLQYKLDRFLLAYQSAPHATTSLSPAHLLLGRNVKTRLDLIKPEVMREVNKKLLQSNISSLKSFAHKRACRGPKWVRHYANRSSPVQNHGG